MPGVEHLRDVQRPPPEVPAPEDVEHVRERAVDAEEGRDHLGVDGRGEDRLTRALSIPLSLSLLGS